MRERSEGQTAERGDGGVKVTGKGKASAGWDECVVSQDGVVACGGLRMFVQRLAFLDI